MTVILKTVSRVMFPLICLFGLYIAIGGHLGPGGAFPAGAVMASGFVLLYLAHLIHHPHKMLKMEEVMEEGALLMILSIVLISLFVFVSAPQALRMHPGGIFSSLSILGLNISAGLEVAAALSIIAISYLLLDEGRIHDLPFTLRSRHPKKKGPRHSLASVKKYLRWIISD